MLTANLLGSLLFSGVGFVAFTYGRKQGEPKIAVIGVALMCYGWFVPDTLWLYGIGVALTAALYFMRG